MKTDHLIKDHVSNKKHFAEVIDLITSAQHRAYQTVNTILIDLYWQIGAYISRKLDNAEWAKRFYPFKFIAHASIL